MDAFYSVAFEKVENQILKFWSVAMHHVFDENITSQTKDLQLFMQNV